MYSKQTLEDLLEKVADRMMHIDKGNMQEGCPIGIIDINNWEWAQGVGLYGLYKYYQISKKEKYYRFLVDWFENRIKEGLPEKNVNTMSPMLTLAFLYEETKNGKYLSVCSEWAEWIINEMPRTDVGGLQHIVTGVINRQQLWDDTLFMTVLFLAKMGMVLGREDYVEESVRQFLVHIKYLFDKKTGLWFHGWTFDGHHNFAAALWGRGNCWITAGISDYIEMVDLKGGVKQYLLDTLEAQVKSLAILQEENGMWHTLLDHPDSYVETSATAGFGYGILKGIRKGYLDRKYEGTGIKALQAVVGNISEDGTVEQVSYGTGMGSSLDFYRNIPIYPMCYGQALTILVLSEGLRG